MLVFRYDSQPYLTTLLFPSSIENFRARRLFGVVPVSSTTLREKLDAHLSRFVLGRSAWDLRRKTVALLSKTGVDKAFFEAPLVSLPPGAEDYLQPSNPRLLELRQEYTTFGGPVAAHYQWAKKKISWDIPLSSFRGDCAFVYQRRENTPANFVLSAYHILASGNAWLLDKLDEDGLFGAQVVPVNGDLKVSRDRIDSVLEIAYLDKLLNLSDRTEKTILDIGAGYGRLGHRLTQAFPNVRVLCTDAVPESTFICEYYLKFRCASPRSRAVPLHELSAALEQNRVDIAVNIHSFSECTSGAIKWWLDILRKHTVRFLLIVPNALGNGGTQLLSREPGETFHNFLGLVEASGYERVAIDPKYDNPELQRYGGVSPTCYHLFRFRNQFAPA